MAVSPWNRVVLLCLLIALFSSSIHHINSGCGTLVTAQKRPFFKQKPVSDPEAARREQQAVEALHALSSSSSSSPPTSDQQDSTLDPDKKKKRLSKGKGIQDLLAAVEASHASSAPASSSLASGEETKEQDNSKNPDTKAPKAIKKNKKASGHEGDIIHEQDHADNDAYDDIVWYDGPHRDDEDEHGDDDHDDDDHDDDHHHDHDDDEEEEEEERRKQASKKTPEVLANLQKLSGTPKSGIEEQGQGLGQGQLVFQNDHDHHNEDESSHEGAKVFQHSGADVIASGISPKEFCLRLKHECESTCREFTAEVEHLPTSCDAGSVAELLFWGRCCQIGQEHRQATRDGAVKSKKKKTTIHLNKSKNLEYTEAEESAEVRQERLIEEHLRSQLKRHQAQQEMNQQKPQ
ncbi:hypothetical protein BGZ81_000284 [Podila clonocystis]|nr:hypothetical protein BGZ81_000284 [Podila clonocystis]